VIARSAPSECGAILIGGARREHNGYADMIREVNHAYAVVDPSISQTLIHHPRHYFDDEALRAMLLLRARGVMSERGDARAMIIVARVAVIVHAAMLR